AAGQDMMGGGISADQGELRMRGPLHAAGTHAQPITLTSTGTGRAQWFGVLFLPGAATPGFSHIDLSEATSGVQIGIRDNRTPADELAPEVTLPMDHVTVTSTTWGMDFTSGYIVLDTARFEDCQYGFAGVYSQSYDGATMTLRNVVFTGNGTAIDLN